MQNDIIVSYYQDITFTNSDSIWLTPEAAFVFKECPLVFLTAAKFISLKIFFFLMISPETFEIGSKITRQNVRKDHLRHPVNISKIFHKEAVIFLHSLH